MLTARGIYKRYGAAVALEDVDLDVARGEIVAIAGENGSGKSTLAKILAGVVSPDRGELVLDGRSCRFSSPREALGRGIALVAQELTSVPELSIAENVLLTRFLSPVRRFSRREANRIAAPLLEQVGVRAHPSAPFKTLPTGERELVEVAKALAARPRLLILDEATSRLSEADVARLFTIVRTLRGEGSSAILITHRLREIHEVADRVVVLRDGRGVGEIAGREASEQRVSSMMVGRELSDFYAKRPVRLGAPLLRLDGFVAQGAASPVSFEIRAGEVVGLAGLIGSGRTELMESIAGVRSPAAGRVLVDGRPVTTGSASAALAAGLALVPEDRLGQGLLLDATVRENLALGSWHALRRASRRRERARGRDIVARVNIRPPEIELPVSALSGGNQQKVVFGRHLTRRPRVLLLDEPTRGIDVGAKHELYELVGELLEQGLAVLLASSELPEILALSDRVLVLHERRVVGELAREEATEERIVYLSGGGRELEDAA